MGDAAADHEQLGVEHRLEAAARLTERGRHAAQRLDGARVAGQHESETAGPLIGPSARAAAASAVADAGGPASAIVVRLTLEGAAGRILLEASVLAAAARADRRG